MAQETSSNPAFAATSSPASTRLVAVEEHYASDAMSAYAPGGGVPSQPSAALGEANRRFSEVLARFHDRLSDLGERRIAEMDAAGIDMQVLSCTTPGVECESDTEKAVGLASQLNDFVAGSIADYGERLRAFAALPLQDPHAAADELERAVSELNFCGAMVNGHTQGRYLDHPSLRVVWERAVALDVPVYLHPGFSGETPDIYRGHPELIGLWSWTAETAAHALRIIFGGVFDDFPQAKLILGHMGEALPYMLWRLDSRWAAGNHNGIELALGRPSEYLRRNVYVTMSGVYDLPPLLCAMLTVGPDHILFAADYPYEDSDFACSFLRDAPISDSDRAKIGHLNAERILHLYRPSPAGSKASMP